MDIEIRQASQHDIPQLSALFDAYRVFYHQTPDAKKAEEFIRARMDKQQSSIFVAADSTGKLRGFVQLYPIFSSVNASESLLLNDLYVDSQSRGLGVGRALMEHARQFAQSQQVCWIMLQTTKDNASAQSLYESLGYQKDSDCYYYYLPLKD